MRISSRFTAQGALAVTVCWVGVLAAAGSTEALLFMAPALLMAIPLLGGHYIGEELIAKLAAPRTRPPARSGKAPAWSLPLAPAIWPARRRHLIASGLAKRPPPAHLLQQT